MVQEKPYKLRYLEVERREEFTTFITYPPAEAGGIQAPWEDLQLAVHDSPLPRMAALFQSASLPVLFATGATR